jgi:pimeloyl-ACP methyl ester carboxylesterase
MILHRAEVEQTIDREERAKFIKELVVVRLRAAGRHDMPLSMVRKRCAANGGSLAPVLLIHGYGQNRYAFHLPGRSLTNYLARAGFDVYNLDLRGHGRSHHLGAVCPSDVTDFVREDVPAAVEEIQRLSGPRPVYLVGHSLGGLVSYAAATELGSAVGGIVTLGSPYHFTRGSWALRLVGGAVLAVDRRLPLKQGAVRLKALGDAVRISRPFVESRAFPLPIRGFRPGSVEPHILAQHMSLALDSGSIPVLRDMFRIAAEARKNGHQLGGLLQYADAFEALNLPLLVIAGTRDDLAPPESVKPAYLRSRSVDKVYRTFPSGHLDLLIGRDAPHTIWPLLEIWMSARARRRAVMTPAA